MGTGSVETLKGLYGELSPIEDDEIAKREGEGEIDTPTG